MKNRNKRERSRDKEELNEKEKREKKEKKVKNKEKENKVININHHWKKYFDSKYNEIFYNNPFTGESVWELPKGAKVEESNEPIEIINNINEKKEEKEKEKEESITEENNEIKDSYKEIEGIEENDLKEKIRYRK